MRIVSLLPSATEIICALGLEDQLVGVTHECDDPVSVQQLPKVTRTMIPAEAPSGEIDRLVRQKLQTVRALYTLDLPVLRELRPDMIVTQTLCDVCAVAEDEVRSVVCALPRAPEVVNLEPQTLSQVFASIQLVANAVGVERVADEVIAELAARVEVVVARTARLQRHPRVALLEWLDPPFSCGHWNPELVRLAGGNEGLGQDFSRPGPRLVDSLEILAHTLHPAVHPLPEGLPHPIRMAGSGVGIVTGTASETG